VGTRVKYLIAVAFLLIFAEQALSQSATPACNKFFGQRGNGSNICFLDLAEALGYIKSETNPASPTGQSLIEPTHVMIDTAGDIRFKYTVPLESAGWVFDAYSLSGGAGSHCDMQDPIQNWYCASELELATKMLERGWLNPSGYRGTYRLGPVRGWHWPTNTALSWVFYHDNSLYSDEPRQQRSFWATAPRASDQTQVGLVHKRRWHVCPALYAPTYRWYSSDFNSGENNKEVSWPQICKNSSRGVITIRNPFQSKPDKCDGNPCVPATGAKEVNESEFEWAGLSFGRHYNSLGELPLAAALGGNWSHTLAHRLHAPASGTGPVLWINERAHFDRFVWRSADNAYLAENSPGTLLYANAGGARWLIRRADGAELAFDEEGRLVRHGSETQALHISYCTAEDVSEQRCPTEGLLLAVQDARGRLLSFEHEKLDISPTGSLSASTIRLTSISDDTGERVRYGWDAQGRLSTVDYPTGAASQQRSYRYAEPSHMCRLHNGAPEAGCDAAQSAQTYSTRLTGIVDEHGVRTADYTYDSRGRVTQSYHAGNAKRVSLDYLSATQVRVTQPEGGSRLYTFSSGRFRKLLSAVEETTDGSVTGTATHNVNTSTFRRNYTVDARGTRTGYTHDAFRETGRTEGLAANGSTTPHTRSFSSTWDNALNRMLTRTEPGREIRFAYNSRGQTTARCEVDLAVPAAVAYTPCGSAANAPFGVRQTRYSYCEEPEASAPGSTCGIVGALKSVDGPRTDVADVSTYAYYPATDESGCGQPSGACHRRGDLHTVTNALGHVVTHARYDRSGRLTRSIDANGVVTELNYHPRGWLLTRTVKGAMAAEDATTTFAYTASGQVQRITQADGSYLVYGYDDAHRLISVTDALGNRIDYTLDPAGNRTSETTFDPQGAVKRQLSRVYNQLGRLKEQRDAQLRAYVSEYDAEGNSTASTDPLGVRSEQSFDPLNRLQQSLQDVAGINAKTEYRYDAQDRLTKVIDPKNLHTDYSYNGLGDLTQLSSPDTGLTGYTVDAAGNRLTQTDARGVTVTMQYDALNRLVHQSNSADSEVIVYRYDGAGLPKGLCEGDFGRGRLSQIEDSLGTLSYCYDRRGNVVAKHRVGLPSFTEQPTLEWSVRYRYTRADQLESVQYPDGEIALYHRDAAGRINAVDYLDGKGISTPLITQVEYAPFGPVSRLVYANGSEWTRALDADYRIDRITAPGIDYDFSLDAVGNITGITQGATSRSFEYDDLYRLTEMKQGSTVLEGFGYDATGNRTSASFGGAPQAYVYPLDSHRLQSVAGAARTYTPAGNTASMGGRNLIYSGFNRLREIQQGGVAQQSNAYNGRGERELRSAGGENRYFGYDEGGRVLFEGAPRAGHCVDTGEPPPPVDSSKSSKGLIEEPICIGHGVWVPASGMRISQRTLWLDDQPIAIKNSSGAYAGELLHVQADHLGSPRVVTRPNAGNAVVWRWRLEGSAFGQHAAEGDPDGDGAVLEFGLRYPGQYYDSVAGWHYNYFRDYEAGTGRYVQSDPIGLVAGVSTYGYALQNALVLIDPDGLKAWYCQRPLCPAGTNCTTGERGPPIVNHQYLCVSRLDGTIECNGQSSDRPTDLISPGRPTRPDEDSYHPESCDEVDGDENRCLEACLLTNFGKGRPTYGIGPQATDCQEWASATLWGCKAHCRRPQNVTKFTDR
jgi:RHS repeat-associated protein